MATQKTLKLVNDFYKREIDEAHAQLDTYGIRRDYNDGDATLATRIQWLKDEEYEVARRAFESAVWWAKTNVGNEDDWAQAFTDWAGK